MPLERQSLSSAVRERISRAIVTGEFSAGDKLAEPVLAARLGVSRAPVREALIGLEFAGLVTSDERGRTSVPVMQPEDLEEIFLVRLALEPLAAQQAALRITPSQIAALRDNIQRMRSVTAQSELSAIDIEFHELMFQASGLPRLCQMWRSICYQIELWLNQMQPTVSQRLEEVRRITVESHEELVASLESGDSERAAATMREHINGWRSRYADRVTAHGSDSPLEASVTTQREG